MTETSDESLQQLVYATLLLDIQALKPGNVGNHAAGHDMQANDFIASAEVTVPILCDNNLSIGQRVLEAVEATKQRVQCNTNLGLILLLTPIIFAMQHKNTGKTLQVRVSAAIDSIDRDETAKFFSAIVLASPGGLGQSDKFDVHLRPEATIKEAMRAATDWDRIAFQYANNFNDIFGLGAETFASAMQHWRSPEWATVACYLTLLTQFRDSHVERKHGREIAQRLQADAGSIAKEFLNRDQPQAMTKQLMRFDEQLKSDGINPGTTADLTIASALVYQLLHRF